MNIIARQFLGKSFQAAAETVTHALPVKAETVSKPLSTFKKKAYKLEAEWRLSHQKNLNKDRFETIKAKLDEEGVQLNLFKKKIANKDWSGLNLDNISFEEAKLSGIQFVGSKMNGCILIRTQAEKCNFSRANITSVIPEELAKTKQDGDAVKFHGETSTFDGATLGGKWNNSNLPIAIEGRTNHIKVEPGTSFESAFFHPRSDWQFVHMVMDSEGLSIVEARQLLNTAMKRRGLSNLDEAREQLLKESSSLRPKQLPDTVPSGTSLPTSRGKRPQKTEPHGKAVKSELPPSSSTPSIVSQDRTTTRSTHSTASVSPQSSSAQQSTPPTSLENSISTLQTNASSKPQTRRIQQEPVLVQAPPASGPHGQIADALGKEGKDEPVKKRFSLKNIFESIKKDESTLATPARTPYKLKKKRVHEKQKASTNEEVQETPVAQKDSSLLMAEWYRFQKDWEKTLLS